MQEIGILFTFIFFALLLAIFMLICSIIAAPKANNENKESIYECGLNIKEKFNCKFKIQFLIYAILFLIFDVETIFIFPFALSYSFLGVFALIEIVIFLGLLLVGLVYAMRTRMLRFK